MICAALGICVCLVAVFLLTTVKANSAALRGKEIKGALSPLAPALTIRTVGE